MRFIAIQGMEKGNLLFCLERMYVTVHFFGMDIGKGYQQGRIVHISETGVETSAENLHGVGQSHVGVDEGRHGLTMFTCKNIQGLIIVPIRQAAEQFVEKHYVLGLEGMRMTAAHQVVLIGKRLLQEVQDRVTDNRFH